MIQIKPEDPPKEEPKQEEPKLFTLYKKSTESIRQGKFEPVKLREIFQIHYGDEEFKKRLERAKTFNKEQDTGIDIEKIMDNDVLIVSHRPLYRDSEGNIEVLPDAMFASDETSIYNVKTGEIVDKYSGNMISVSQLFDVSSDQLIKEVFPFVLPHEANHAQYVNAGFSLKPSIPEKMGEEITPSGNRHTEVHAYGQNIVDILNRYQTDTIDPGSYDDPVGEMPKWADKAVEFLKADVKQEKDALRVKALNDLIKMVEWAKKPFEALNNPKYLNPKQQKSHKRNINKLFKSLVTIENGQYVIQKG